MGPAGGTAILRLRMFRLQMPNETAGEMYEETAHSRYAKGVWSGMLPKEPRLNEMEIKKLHEPLSRSY